MARPASPKTNSLPDAAPAPPWRVQNGLLLTMKIATIDRRWNVAAMSVITAVFVLVMPHLRQPKQAFLAASLLVIAYGVLFSTRRLLTLVLTAVVIIMATVGIVLLATRT